MNTHNGISPLYPSVFRDVPELVGLQTTRTGGTSDLPWDSLNLGPHTKDLSEHIRENFRRLSAHLDISPDAIILSEQVHGTLVHQATCPGNVSGYDALITDREGIYLGILTADCYPVLMYDRRLRTCGAAHAGWQGTAGRISEITLRAMARAFGTRPEDCLAWIGTGISQEHYEIGDDVARQFDERYLRQSPSGPGKHLLDLSSANREQLLETGIPESQVECSPFCSWRDREQFFSYRRDNGSTGRMLSLIGLRPSG
ncbi:MAG: peptidoglycan editing factor PgeF [Chlorobiaceae bacterium]|nr:peptidoglycan editing factor PgeF [Chlorobiaceae bacterium]